SRHPARDGASRVRYRVSGDADPRRARHQRGAASGLDALRLCTMPTLETPRLLLRPFARGDARDHARISAKPEVTRFLAGGPFLGPEAVERSRAAQNLFLNHWKAHGFGVWAVIDKVTGVLIGQCGLKYLPDQPDVE